MDKPIITTLGQITPVTFQQYERYLPSAFNESLSILEKMNKMINNLNEIGQATTDVITQWNQVMEWVVSNGLEDMVNAKLDTWLTDGTMASLLDTTIFNDLKTDIDKNTADIQKNTTDITNIKNITKSFTHVPSETSPDVSVSVATADSLYIPNDANVFGYKADGTHLNIGTVQQNDIVQYGDPNVENLWVESGGYLSLRSANNPSFQKISSDNLGTPLESGRTLFHVGNMCNHAMSSVSAGTQLMTQNTFNYLTIADINGQFPNGNFNGTDYIIPRSGLYLFDFTVRPTSLVNQFSVCRIGHTKGRTGIPTNYNMKDIVMSSAYGTGFYGNTYMKEFVAGDVISPFIYPLTEDITIQSGTKVNIYFLGDKPTA